jgi:hypothetical protein
MPKPNKTVAGTADDPTLKFAEMSLGGKTYRLALTYNTIAQAEALAGCNMLAGLDSLHDLNAAQFRGLFFCALRLAHPDLTIEAVGNLIGIKVSTRNKIVKALAEAYRLAWEREPEDPPEAGAPAPG